MRAQGPGQGCVVMAQGYHMWTQGMCLVNWGQSLVLYTLITIATGQVGLPYINIEVVTVEII